MKTVKDKQILMAADFAGYPLKEAIKEYLEKKGWTVTDIGVKADSDPNDTELMFHRIGLRVGAMITEKEFERALIFCGTGKFDDLHSLVGFVSMFFQDSVHTLYRLVGAVVFAFCGDIVPYKANNNLLPFP